MTKVPAGVTKMPGMLIIWTSWAGQAPPVVELLEATIINILPSVILIAQPRRGSHPELGAPWELPWLHSPRQGSGGDCAMGTRVLPGRSGRAEDVPQPDQLA